MQRMVSTVPMLAMMSGMMRKRLGRLWGKFDRKRAATRESRTMALPRTRERRRRWKIGRPRNDRRCGLRIGEVTRCGEYDTASGYARGAFGATGCATDGTEGDDW